MTTVDPTERADRLAIEGGAKAFASMHGPREPKIGVEEFLSLAERFGFSAETIEQIERVVSNDELGAGPNLARYMTSIPPETKGMALEKLARETFGVEHALATSSGTAALHAAFVAAGVKPGTEVIVPAIGFFATAAAVVMAKGIPIFCDVDESLHIDPRKIEDKITPRTVAVVPTSVMGGVCDMDPILEVARKHGLKVIEDCAQAPGAKYRGRYVGTLGDFGCFSISCYKTVGGGEGGLLLCNDQKLFDGACQLAECGGFWRPDRFATARYPGELFCGTNYRMSELEAAVNLVQLKKMPASVRRYNTAKRRILSQLKTYREITPQRINDPEGEVGATLRFFPRTVELGKKIAAALNAEGVGCGRFIFPSECAVRDENAPPDWHVYSEMMPLLEHSRDNGSGSCPFNCPSYTGQGGSVTYAKGDCPVADDLFDRNIMVWLSDCYDEVDCAAIAAGMNKVFDAYCTEGPDAVKWL